MQQEAYQIQKAAEAYERRRREKQELKKKGKEDDENKERIWEARRLAKQKEDEQIMLKRHANWNTMIAIYNYHNTISAVNNGTAYTKARDRVVTWIRNYNAFCYSHTNANSTTPKSRTFTPITDYMLRIVMDYGYSSQDSVLHDLYDYFTGITTDNTRAAAIYTYIRDNWDMFVKHGKTVLRGMCDMYIKLACRAIYQSDTTASLAAKYISMAKCIADCKMLSEPGRTVVVAVAVANNPFDGTSLSWPDGCENESAEWDELYMRTATDGRGCIYTLRLVEIACDVHARVYGTKLNGHMWCHHMWWHHMYFHEDLVQQKASEKKQTRAAAQGDRPYQDWCGIKAFGEHMKQNNVARKDGVPKDLMSTMTEMPLGVCPLLYGVISYAEFIVWYNEQNNSIAINITSNSNSNIYSNAVVLGATAIMDLYNAMNKLCDDKSGGISEPSEETYHKSADFIQDYWPAIVQTYKVHFEWIAADLNATRPNEYQSWYYNESILRIVYACVDYATNTLGNTEWNTMLDAFKRNSAAKQRITEWLAEHNRKNPGKPRLTFAILLSACSYTRADGQHIYVPGCINVRQFLRRVLQSGNDAADNGDSGGDVCKGIPAESAESAESVESVESAESAEYVESAESAEREVRYRWTGVMEYYCKQLNGYIITYERCLEKARDSFVIEKYIDEYTVCKDNLETLLKHYSSQTDGETVLGDVDHTPRAPIMAELSKRLETQKNKPVATTRVGSPARSMAERCGTRYMSVRPMPDLSDIDN